MIFSQRIGKTPVKVELEKEGLSPELRNLLWNEVVFSIRKNSSDGYLKDVWLRVLKKPVDEFPEIWDDFSRNEFAVREVTDSIKLYFYNSDWFIALDFIEFSAKYHPQFCEVCNIVLSQEMSAYRFVDGQLVEINSKEEVLEIEDAISNTDQFSPVKTHLETALRLLSDRKSPDYRNSVKESISALEALVKLIADDSSIRFDYKSLTKNEKVKHIAHPALIKAISALFGYTSDEGGIRHALTEKSVEITLSEARFMLVTCSAFVNYLLSKM